MRPTTARSDSARSDGARSGGEGAQAVLARLRRDIARLEGRLAEDARLELDACGRPDADVADEGAPDRNTTYRDTTYRDRPGGSIPQDGRLQPFGVGRLDAMLGGGLALGGLHEVRTAESRDGPCAAGFLAALMASRDGPAAGDAGARPSTHSFDGAIVWISEADRRREAGDLYPPGLVALGLDPDRIIRIAAPRTADALWTFEAALACRGVAFAVCEVRRQARCLDLTATRRLALRAQGSGATGLLLRLGQQPEPTAAVTRFMIAPAPSRPAPGDVWGRPAWHVDVEKTRFGRAGGFRLEWDVGERRFAEGHFVEREEEGHEGSVGSAGGDCADPVAVAAADGGRAAGAGGQGAA